MSSTRLNRFVKVAYHLITPYGHFWSLYIYTHFYMRVYAYIPLARSLNNKYTFRFENHAIGIRTPDTAVSEYPSLERTAERFSFCVQSVFHLFLYFFFFPKTHEYADDISRTSDFYQRTGLRRTRPRLYTRVCLNICTYVVRFDGLPISVILCTRMSAVNNNKQFIAGRGVTVVVAIIHTDKYYTYLYIYTSHILHNL